MRNLHKRLLTELLGARLLLARSRSPSDTAIHGARQHVKRARAILRLLSSAIGLKTYRQVNLALRDVNRVLRQARDRAVIMQTLESIGVREPQMKPASLRIRAFWRRHRDDGRAPAVPSIDRRAALAGLTRATAAVHKCPLAPKLERSALTAIRSSYRKAQKAYRHASRTGSQADWHECRKQTKYLYYQLQFTKVRSLKRPRAIYEARVLGSVLGKERDLALLAAELERTGVDRSAAGGAMLLRVDHRRARLQRRCAAHGARLFRDKASAFARGLRASSRV